jgi:hypothetical protein
MTWKRQYFNAPSLSSVILIDALSRQPILESASFKGFSNFCDLVTKFSRASKQVMPVPRTTTTMESAVIAFFLFVASACIPFILFISQQVPQGHNERVELLLQQQEELPKPQSGFAESLWVATTTTTLRGRGVLHMPSQHDGCQPYGNGRRRIRRILCISGNGWDTAERRRRQRQQWQRYGRARGARASLCQPESSRDELACRPVQYYSS